MILKEILQKIPWLGRAAERLSRHFFIMPFYVVRESLSAQNEIELDPDLQPVEAFVLARDEIVALAGHEETPWSATQLLGRMDEGQICMGLRGGDKLLAYTWGGERPVAGDWLGLDPLKENEAYLHDAYCFKAYRGRKLIPYLRRRMYEHFAERGRDSFLSISTYTNTSSIRFKRKLGAMVSGLYLRVRLTRRFQRSFLLKNYEA